MQSEDVAVEARLHPASIAFWVVARARQLIVPIVVGGFSASQWGLGWPRMVAIILLPIVLYSVIRFLTFRYRFEERELVVRKGLIFRQVRTIPYSRIQNLDAVQGVAQRLFDVVEVQLQTGGGTEPEARLSVIPTSAVPELRRRVFAGREGPRPVGGTAGEPGLREPREALVATVGLAEEHAGDVLLHLPPRELLIYGLIQNKGMIVIAAGMGLVWELGLIENYAVGAIGNSEWFQELFRDASGAAGALAAFAAIGLLGAALAGLFVVARVLSIAWAFVRLHDFTISRRGEDLRTTFGLFTRVTATIPLHRIQKLTVHEGPLHRLARRAAVRVETAGGTKYESQEESHRQWLAPILRRDRLEHFVGEVLPELDFSSIRWEPVAPGATRRVFKEGAVVAGLVSIPFFFLLGPGALPIAALLFVLAGVYARTYVANLGWSVTNGSVLFKSGWLWRRTSVARFVKIQTVSLRQTPFDRRRDMARVRVDTAGAGAASHAVHIPYLQAPRAEELAHALTAEAARTTFHW